MNNCRLILRLNKVTGYMIMNRVFDNWRLGISVVTKKLKMLLLF